MPTRLRQATRNDIPGIWDVRYAVQENTLRRGVIADEDVRCAIEDTGRGWVVETSDDAGERDSENRAGGDFQRILAFAIANAQDGNLWALFVHPQAQGRGHGRQLYDTLLDWLRARGLQRLWLTTGPGTQALGFYQRRGWQLCREQDDDEDLVLELHLPGPPGPPAACPAAVPAAIPDAGIR